MKKSLLQRRALYAALFVLLLSVAGMKNALAQNQVATLQHGDDISVFYGQNAFVEAHNAAGSGDVITLSSGTFTPCNIFKAITLRGAGCAIDTVTGTYPTVIPNSFTMNVTNGMPLTIEGIFFSGSVTAQTLSNPSFIKCNFESFTGSNYIQNAQITNCKFKNYNFNGTNTTLINCVVWSAGGMNNTSISVTAYNSFIRLIQNACALNAYNCIIARPNEGYQSALLTSNSIAYNCIGLKDGHYSEVFGCQTFNCMSLNFFTEIYETFNGEFSFDESFILKEEIATSFLGTDGTEVGIHGGTMPYSSRPSYMILKHCNVANRSTIDGKLSVDIEVITEDE